jgi:ABC-type dipeptide/oligopeptide/nickel transport system permease component
VYHLLNRLAILLLTVVAATTILFALVHASGDPTDGFLAPGSPPEVRQATRERLGLDQPLAEQYLVFLGRGLTLDFGDSWRNRQPALETVVHRLPATLTLAALAIAIATAGGVTIGLASAAVRSGFLRQLARGVALVGLAVPSFWLGTIGIVVFAVRLGWLPASGNEGWKALVLPALTLAAYPGALIARLVQTSLLEVASKPYLTVARAKGLKAWTVWVRHALPNALLPVIGIVGLQAGFLVGGAVVVESVFAWPGVGRLAMQATTDRDIPVIQAFVTLTIVLVALINIIADMLADVIDPVQRHAANAAVSRG